MGHGLPGTSEGRIELLVEAPPAAALEGLARALAGFGATGIDVGQLSVDALPTRTADGLAVERVAIEVQRDPANGEGTETGAPSRMPFRWRTSADWIDAITRATPSQLSAALGLRVLQPARGYLDANLEDDEGGATGAGSSPIGSSPAATAAAAAAGHVGSGSFAAPGAEQEAEADPGRGSDNGEDEEAWAHADAAAVVQALSLARSVSARGSSPRAVLEPSVDKVRAVRPQRPALRAASSMASLSRELCCASAGRSKGALETPALVLCAPPGHGKSVALRQLQHAICAQEQRRCTREIGLVPLLIELPLLSLVIRDMCASVLTPAGVSAVACPRPRGASPPTCSRPRGASPPSARHRMAHPRAGQVSAALPHPPIPRYTVGEPIRGERVLELYITKQCVDGHLSTARRDMLLMACGLRAVVLLLDGYDEVRRQPEPPIFF